MGNGFWSVSQRIEHLGFLLDTQQMRLFVSDRKVQRVRRMASHVLLRGQRNRCVVSAEYLRSFCGVCVSLTLSVPLARFYLRAVFFDMALVENEKRAKIPRRSAERRAKSETRREAECGGLSHKSIRDIPFWRSLSRVERELQLSRLQLNLYSDSVDVEWCGTLGQDLSTGPPGLSAGQGFYAATELMKSITLWKLQAVRLLPLNPLPTSCQTCKYKTS